jgi:hypothetical protein
MLWMASCVFSRGDFGGLAGVVALVCNLVLWLLFSRLSSSGELAVHLLGLAKSIGGRRSLMVDIWAD